MMRSQISSTLLLALLAWTAMPPALSQKVLAQ